MAGNRVGARMVWRCGVAGIILGGMGLTLVAGAQETQRVAAKSETRYADTHVTVRMQDAQLKAVLGEISRQAGLSMVYSKDVLPSDRRVTVKVVNIPALDAYRIALRGTNLTVSISPTGRAVFARTSAEAPSGIIVGRVIDGATKRPVAGATVMIQGTKLAARTDEKGVYKIVNVPEGTHTLVVRRLGYSATRAEATVTEDETTTADITLSATATALNAVVTTVTGLQRRLEVGNDIGLIKADSLMKEAPITTLSQLLTSRVPGLAVAQGQGTVGGDVRLQIRGLSSLTLSNEPIVIVDGVRYTSSALATRRFVGNSGRESVSPLNDLNPNDVETVEVVKGPSAATLYGTDASNGVIVITTKRGKPGPARWDVYGTRDFTEIERSRPADDVWYGWGPTRDGEYRSDCSIYGVLSGYCSQDSVTHGKSIGAQDAFSILKPSQSWTSGIAVSGGVPNLTYRVGGNYTSLVGAISVPDTALKIAKARGTPLPDNFLRPNTSSTLGLESSVRATVGHGLELNLTGNYARGETHSIDAEGGPWQAGLNLENTGTQIANNIVDLFSRSSGEENQRFVGSIQMQFHPTSAFSARAVIGVDGDVRTLHEYVPRDSTRDYYAFDPRGSIYDRQSRTNNTTADGGASLRIALGWLSFNTSVGGQYNRSTDDASEGKGNDLVPGTSSINFAKTRTFSQIYSQRVSLGTYVEEVVGINDRFFVTGAVRIDGATGFGEKYRAAGYPKVSGSWLVSQEPFIPRIPGLTQLRIRAAYGVSGQQSDPTAKLPYYSLQTSDVPGYGQALMIDGIGNPELRPEKTGEFERGLDVVLLQQRVNLGLTWYHRRTRDQIIRQQLAAGLGSIPRNIGLTTGDGFEMSVTANVIATNPLALSFTLNESRHQTKVLDLKGGPSNINDAGGYAVGYPIGAVFRPSYLGYEDKNGDGMLYRSYNEDPENEVFFTDTTAYIGVTNPPRQQTLVTNVGLFQQRLRFSAVLNRESGALTQRGFMNDVYNMRGVYDRTAPLDEQVLRYSQIDYEPMNFTRLREVSIAWTIPSQMTRLIHASSSSVSLSGRNLALWTSYRGGDPESQPIDWSPIYRRPANGIPQNRTWLLRFDLSL